MGNEVGIDLYLRNELLHILYQFHEKLPLHRQYLLVSTQYLLLVLLEFGCDVTLCLRQCLFADPILRHLVLERIAYL